MVSVFFSSFVLDPALTYDGVDDLQHGQRLREQHQDPRGRVHLVETVGEGGQGRPREDGQPEQRGHGVVPDEVGPLGEHPLEDSHGLQVMRIFLVAQVGSVVVPVFVVWG